MQQVGITLHRLRTDFTSFAAAAAVLPDLLAVQMLPEWPVATVLLRRFLKMLYSEHGLKHKDTAVKLAAVEFTGVLAARLCCEVLQAEKEAEEVQALLEAAEAAAGALWWGWAWLWCCGWM